MGTLTEKFWFPINDDGWFRLNRKDPMRGSSYLRVGLLEVLIKELTTSARKKTEEELRELADYFRIYCSEKHEGVKAVYINSWGLAINPDHKFCPECQELLNYSVGRYLRCSYSPKPDCKSCDNLCFSPEYRLQFQEVIRFVENLP